MKNGFLSFTMILFFLIGCGEDNTSISGQNGKDTSVVVSVKSLENSKIFSKQTLSINYMQVQVYNAQSATDESYLDKTPINTKAFTKTVSDWTVSLSNLERDKYYIFVVTAFSSNDTDASKLIFKGIKNHQILEGINEIEINLAQTANADTVENLPSVPSIVATRLADSSVELSFTISNPYEQALAWEIRDDGLNTVSSDFSLNTGSTSALSTAIKVDYLLPDSNNYLLILSTSDATVSYHFSITIEDETDEVEVTVETAPIITKLIVSVVGNELTLTPELDKEADLYAWEIVENLGSAISIENASVKSAKLTEYTISSEFKIKLTVSSASGAFSYRIYYIGGNYDASVVVVPPVVVESSNIKKTQQTKSYDYLGDEDVNVKDDGNYKKGITPSYTKNPITKIVTDNVTSLMWQDDNDTELKWAQANNYCDNSIIGSFNDWRLPTRQELQTLTTYFPLDSTSTINEVLLDDTFVKMRTISHWSSSIQPDIVGDEQTIIVNFRRFRYGESNGRTIFGGSYGVRCVRGTLAQVSFSKKILTSIVTDPLNNLEWQDNGVYGEDETWSQAIDRCENLSLGTVPNDKGWRLPNINELMSIVDKPKSGSAPKMNSAFTAHPSFGHSYWSSTADFANKNFAYSVRYDFGASGTVGSSPKSNINIGRHTRCVRDVSSSGE